MSTSLVEITNVSIASTSNTVSGVKEDRTPGLLRAKQALYQLSYDPASKIHLSRKSKIENRKSDDRA